MCGEEADFERVENSGGGGGWGLGIGILGDRGMEWTFRSMRQTAEQFDSG